MNTLNNSIAMLALCAGIVGQAAADSLVTPVRAELVRAADLDLTKPEDVESLYERIRSKARSLCRAEYSTAFWDVRRRKHAQECFEQAVDLAVVRANHSGLAALHLRAAVRVARR